MYFLILFIPLLSATVAGLFGRKLGEKGAGIYTTASILVTSGIAWVIFYEVGLSSSPVYLHLWSWIDSGLFSISFGLQFDSVTAVMLVLVTTVSGLVHLYSTEYMNGDPHLPRFMSYLSLFTFFMIVLVTSDNLLQLFIGWEGVGLCSYLLINFWYTRIQANKSAIKAMVVNRVGDVGIALAMFASFYVFKTVDFATIFALAPYYENQELTFLGIENINALGLITVLILIGAVGKSAQVGLHTWLPDAMEGLFCFRRQGLSLNSTICGNILDNWSTLKFLSSEKSNYCIGQSAGNLNIIHDNFRGTSETTCGKFDNKFLEWFKGFTEGDGSFIVNKNGYLEFKITQSSNDAQILFYIKKMLGFGQVSIQDRKNKTHHFRVRNKDSLLKIIHIFNGKLYTKHRKIQFQQWVHSFNLIYNENIPTIENNLEINEEFLNSAWLSGFTDAEGCFTISMIKRSNTYTQVQVRYILSQKEEKEFLTQISNLIGGKVHYLKTYGGYNLVVNLTKLNKIIKYIKINKLKTKKHIKYLNWLKVYNMVINKEHLNPENLQKIEKQIKI